MYVCMYPTFITSFPINLSRKWHPCTISMFVQFTDTHHSHFTLYCTSTWFHTRWKNVYQHLSVWSFMSVAEVRPYTCLQVFHPIAFLHYWLQETYDLQLNDELHLFTFVLTSDLPCTDIKCMVQQHYQHLHHKSQHVCVYNCTMQQCWRWQQ